ncbi:hypothetical protein BofuT4_uP069110.1 [Botrytis cinerea T4]|uniref:Uncharacterized protein n=1 Tax=Botryotinia fuckeliana (strain T4) TaxID=999810 RepID=G2XQG6_BOTF4|nr:hypothetical protein BofuT4_uP069110.1 [Botrytis cinerea T4]
MGKEHHIKQRGLYLRLARLSNATSSSFYPTSSTSNTTAESSTLAKIGSSPRWMALSIRPAFLPHHVGYTSSTSSAEEL